MHGVFELVFVSVVFSLFRTNTLQQHFCSLLQQVDVLLPLYRLVRPPFQLGPVSLNVIADGVDLLAKSDGFLGHCILI